MRRAKITGWGKCLPPAALTNDDLARLTDTSDEWIMTRTGIRERRISHVGSGELGRVAAERALACAGRSAEEINMIIFASATPDLLVPNTASRLQLALGNDSASAFDINSGCTGFVYGQKIASDHLSNNPDDVVLVVGAERLTWYLDWTQREHAVLFGDGAGAAVFEASDTDAGVLCSHIGCEPGPGEALMIADFGTAMDRFGPDPMVFDLRFDGRVIFGHAVKGMASACETVLGQAGLGVKDIDLVIPHQANERIIDALADRLGMDHGKVFKNIADYGNTSAATIPVGLTEALEQGLIKPGANLLMAAFGAGLTWGASVVRWGDRIEPLGVSDAELPPCNQSAMELISDAVAFFSANNQDSEAPAR
ncbi:MAG: ketoacyl-ACP synthase III [Gammaproteobacteria bacterium]|nr:ketoacyl-ACP synthase III [Gammaproteobacteria bacterium]